MRLALLIAAALMMSAAVVAQDAPTEQQAMRAKLASAMRLLAEERYPSLLELLVAPSEIERLKAEGRWERAQEKFRLQKTQTMHWLLSSMLRGSTEIEIQEDGRRALFRLSRSGQRLATMTKEDGQWYLDNN